MGALAAEDADAIEAGGIAVEIWPAAGGKVWAGASGRGGSESGGEADGVGKAGSEADGWRVCEGEEDEDEDLLEESYRVFAAGLVGGCIARGDCCCGLVVKACARGATKVDANRTGRTGLDKRMVGDAARNGTANVEAKWGCGSSG